MELATLNGRFYPLSELDPAWQNHGTFFGDGVYDVMRSYNNKIFALDDHMIRLANSIKAIEIEGIDVEIIREQIVSSFEKSTIENAKIYIQVTRGCGPRSHLLKNTMKPDVLIIISNLDDAADQKQNGIKVISYPDLRWKRCDIKSLNLLPNIMATRAAQKKKCIEAILVNDDNFITEGASSSFFAIFDSKIHTTPLKGNILPSISRKYVFKAAQDLGIPIVEKHININDISKSHEMFIGVTTRDVVGIVKFDEHIIGDGKVGPMTRKLEEQFATYV